MNIGIDVDNTITAYPNFFVEYCKGMRMLGHKIYIYILTSIYEYDERFKELSDMGIEFDDLICTAEKKKLEFVNKLDIDFVFDDNLTEYNRQMSNVPFRFVRFK